MTATIELAAALVMDDRLHERGAFPAASLVGVFGKQSLTQLPGLWERFVPHLP